MNILIAGAAPDTNNMGVSALLMSTLYGVLKVYPDAHFYVLDYGTGVRSNNLAVGDRKAIPVKMIGVRAGKKIFHPGNLHKLLFLSNFPFLNFLKNETLGVFSEMDVLLDISGGDSFSDIYGSKRFFEVTAIKRLIAKMGVPLILLPQTYGPYKGEANYLIAKEIVMNASMVMARDRESYNKLEGMLAGKLYTDRHVDGVDVAFSLPVREPKKLAPLLRKKILRKNAAGQFKLGLNISGLVYQNKQRASDAFGFKADYNQILRDFIQWALGETEAEIFLIPHVMEPEGHYESDWGGSKRFIDDNDLQSNARIHLLPRDLECDEVKWVISHMDWFCGMRMHSTIAALSTGVPTTSIAYSDKTLGVFKTCSQESQVFDPRSQSNEEIVGGLIDSIKNRKNTKLELESSIPEVIQKSADQFSLIANFLSCLKV